MSGTEAWVFNSGFQVRRFQEVIDSTVMTAPVALVVAGVFLPLMSRPRRRGRSEAPVRLVRLLQNGKFRDIKCRQAEAAPEAQRESLAT